MHTTKLKHLSVIFANKSSPIELVWYNTRKLCMRVSPSIVTNVTNLSVRNLDYEFTFEAFMNKLEVFVIFVNNPSLASIP